MRRRLCLPAAVRHRTSVQGRVTRFMILTASFIVSCRWSVGWNLSNVLHPKIKPSCAQQNAVTWTSKRTFMTWWRTCLLTAEELATCASSQQQATLVLACLKFNLISRATSFRWGCQRWRVCVIVHTRLWLPLIRFHCFASFRELNHNHNLKKKRKQLENWPKPMIKEV